MLGPLDAAAKRSPEEAQSQVDAQRRERLPEEGDGADPRPLPRWGPGGGRLGPPRDREGAREEGRQAEHHTRLDLAVRQAADEEDEGEGARAEMVRLLDSGTDIGIAADGPKGPPEVLKPGAAWLCAKTGHPVLPMAFSSSRALRLRTWDRFLVPRPFTRAVWLVGEPIRRRDGEEFEALRCRIEAAIREITARADALVAPGGPGRASAPPCGAPGRPPR